jgi:methanogenic corrinoid protein MtbC1
VTEAGSTRARSLVELIVDMEEGASLALITERLAAGEDPVGILDECRQGIERVGQLYEQGVFYVAALIMAGEIFREATEILLPLVAAKHGSAKVGRAVVATVRGDIHDLGKNIMAALLDSNGYTVVDLGVDTPVARVVEAVLREQPDVLGLSCLLTSAYEGLRETISAVREATGSSGRRLPIIIGGSSLTETVRELVGADAWCHDAASGMEFIRGVMPD